MAQHKITREQADQQTIYLKNAIKNLEEKEDNSLQHILNTLYGFKKFLEVVPRADQKGTPGSTGMGSVVDDVISVYLNNLTII
jgi:hypothetical protein